MHREAALAFTNGSKSPAVQVLATLLSSSPGEASRQALRDAVFELEAHEIGGGAEEGLGEEYDHDYVVGGSAAHVGVTWAEYDDFGGVGGIGGSWAIHFGGDAGGEGSTPR
ncbi:unnamed protein product [Sphagnum balticum]